MRRHHYISLLTVAAIIAATALLGSCSLKKNTAASRNYTAFITRYNIYFNGDEHYKETLRQMESGYEDDYTRLIPVHPANAYADEALTNPTGDFTRSIEKAQKAIELRSIKKKPRRKAGKRNDAAYQRWLKREEYNPFLHNAWLMLGRSQFMNGDFLGASTTFAYIARHFAWLPTTVTEADLWQARCYAALGWTFEAERLLSRVKETDLTTPALRSLYYLTDADMLIKSGRIAEAAAPLHGAVDLAKGPMKTRLRFLLGQVLERSGDRAGAYAAFGKVADASSAPYRTRFNARIKQSEVYTGSDINGEIKSLRSMLRFDRNKEYSDQIHYAIGNLYLSRRDTTKAIDSYILASKESTRNGIDRALAQLRLGSLYFDRRRYDLAQPCYSEAVGQLPADFPDLKQIRRRSEVLDELAVYAGNVALQDSLLRLSAMSPEEQLAVANRLIDELKKREKEEAEENRRAEYEASRENAATSAATQTTGNAPATFSINNDRSWYFYNTAVKNAGKTEFQKRWGARKLEDDWRRRNKTSFSFSDFDTSEASDSSDQSDQSDQSDIVDIGPSGTEAANDPHNPEYYLAQIPSTDIEKATAREVIQEGLYNMGLILKDKLEDFPAAAAQWDILLRDYPDNIYRLDTYFNLYLMYMRLGDTAQAEIWRRRILGDFADSEQGLALRDPDYIGSLRRMNERQDAVYEEAYAAFIEGDNATVRRKAAEMADSFPMSPMMPKMMFVDALTYVSPATSDEFAGKIRTLLERYPDADVSPLASSWLRDLTRGRKLESGAVRAMVWEQRLTNDTTLAFDPEEAPDFDIADESDPLFILTYATDSVSPNRLLYDIARHNFSTFKVKDYDLEQMNFGRLGLLVVSGFGSMTELGHYRATLPQLGPRIRPVTISRKNFDLLLSRGRSFDDYFRAVQAARVDRLEDEAGIPPEEAGADSDNENQQSDLNDIPPTDE